MATQNTKSDNNQNFKYPFSVCTVYNIPDLYSTPKGKDKTTNRKHGGVF